MQTFIKKVFPLMAVLIGSLACVTLSGDPTPMREAVANIVAETLTASPPQETSTTFTEPSPEASTSTIPFETIVAPTIQAPLLKVTYIHNGNVWLWTEGIGQAQLSTIGGAVAVNISDDGQVVAFIRRGSDDFHNEIWAVNTDGSNQTSLVSQADFDAISNNSNAITVKPNFFDWIPESHTLAFNTYPVWDGPGFFPNNDMHLVDVDTGLHTRRLESGRGGNFYCSPDGSQIALVTPESLSLINADGSNRRDLLTFPFIYTYSEWQYYPEPVWAADSSALRVAIPPQDPLGNPGALTLIWHIPSDGSMPYMAGEIVAAPAFVSSPLISPDLQKLLYLIAPGEAFDNLELHWMDLSTGEVIPYHRSGNLRILGWAPDSSQFVYALTHNTDPQLGEVGLLPFALTDRSNIQNVSWIDNTRFLFLSGSSRAWELRLGPPGGPSTLIANPTDDFTAYDFTQ